MCCRLRVCFCVLMMSYKPFEKTKKVALRLDPLLKRWQSSYRIHGQKQKRNVQSICRVMIRIGFHAITRMSCLSTFSTLSFIIIPKLQTFTQSSAKSTIPIRKTGMMLLFLVLIYKLIIEAARMQTDLSVLPTCCIQRRAAP